MLADVGHLYAMFAGGVIVGAVFTMMGGMRR